MCKQLKPNKEVYKRIDPYQEDINGIIVKRLMCNDCEEQLRDDI